MKRDQNAQTLIEFLIVVAIIATLAGMLIPAICRAREEARKIQQEEQEQNTVELKVECDIVAVNTNLIEEGEDWRVWLRGGKLDAKSNDVNFRFVVSETPFTLMVKGADYNFFVTMKDFEKVPAVIRISEDFSSIRFSVLRYSCGDFKLSGSEKRALENVVGKPAAVVPPSKEEW